MALHPFVSGRWLKENNLDQNEKWYISNDENGSPTSFCYVPTNELKSIFLGSLPIWEISEGNNHEGLLEFFYGSRKNSFWAILHELLDAPVQNVADRMRLMDNCKIGLTDIILKYERDPFNGSSDKNIFPEKYNNIVDLLSNFHSIKNIFVTSGGKTPAQNLYAGNKSVATWLKDSINHLHPIGFNAQGYVKRIRIKNKVFNLIALLSPSNNTNRSIKQILNTNNNFGIENLTIGEFREYFWCYYLNHFHFEGSNEQINKKIDFIIQNQKLANFFER